MLTLFVDKGLSSRWVGILSVFSIYLYLILLPGKAQSIFLMLTNMLIVVISCGIVYSVPSRSVSILKICGIFFLIFFGLTPILEYGKKVVYWGGAEISEYDYIVSNIIIVIGILIFLFVYKYSYLYTRLSRRSDDASVLIVRSKNQRRFVRFLPVLIICSLFVLWFNNFNIYNLLLRGGELVGEVAIGNKAIGLVVNNFFRPFIFSIAIFCVFITKYHAKYATPWRLFFLSLAFFICFPTSLPRFAIAALYIPLILISFPSLLDRKFFAINIFILSFLTVFPFFNAFRRIGSDFSFESIAGGFNLDFLLAGHFDAYQNFTRTISLNIVTEGRQLLGSILFFVPRAVWSDKPIGSGELLAQMANYNFSNISQSLPAEGYVNFGILGSFLFLAVAGYYAAKLDHGFWVDKIKSLRSTSSLYYFQAIGLTVFIMRGDLTNAIAYTSGFMLSMMVACRIYKMRSLRLGSKFIW